MIKKLSQEIINKIAAGEVVLSPYSAIKELIENSIDAESTSIFVECINGGLKEITIKDNGSGIESEDFPLLCERHATSKIQSIEDLRQIASCGFRGEALASISFVSHIKISSKRKGRPFGYTGNFSNGKLREELEPLNMEQGTIIKVDDLFYNLPSRKKSISPGESFRSILGLIQSLSLNYPRIQFNLACSKNKLDFTANLEIFHGQVTEMDARLTLASQIIKIPADSLIYLESEIPEYKVKFRTALSKVGCLKTRELVLFINDRLVECPALKSAVESAYRVCWNSIHEEEGGYFCYLGLEMKRENIDVNVHPSKKLIKFIYEKEISEKISLQIENILKQGCQVKDFSVVNLNKLKIANLNKTDLVKDEPIKKKEHDYSKLRSDAKLLRIDTFFKSTNNNTENTEKQNIEQKPCIKENEEDYNEKSFDIEHRQIAQDLLMECKQNSHKETMKYIQQLIYVGCLNSNYVIFQENNKLLLLNIIPIALQLFYQFFLMNIKKFETIKLDEPLKIDEVLYHYILAQDQSEEKATIFKELATKRIEALSNFLFQYFRIKIQDGHLLSLPSLNDLPLKGKLTSTDNQIIAQFLFDICKLDPEISHHDLIKQTATSLAELYSWSLKEQNIFSDEEHVVWEDYFAGKFLRSLKTSCFLSELDFDLFSHCMITLEECYRYFERC